MQRIVGNIVPLHEVGGLLARPVKQRIDLDEIALRRSNDANDATRGRQIASRADPVIQAAPPASARASGLTLRDAQQSCRAATDERKPSTPCCGDECLDALRFRRECADTRTP